MALIKLKKKKRLWIDWTATILGVIGMLNWGIYAFGGNLIEALIGEGFFANAIFFLVGLSGLWIITKKALTGYKFMK